MIEAIFSYIAGFFTLIVVKAISEPIALRVGNIALNKAKEFLPSVFDSLDLEWIPKEYAKSGLSTIDWLAETCIPEKAKEANIELSSKEAEIIANYVIEKFDLSKHLEKLVDLGL